MNESELISSLIDWAPNWVGPVVAVLFVAVATLALAALCVDGWLRTAPTADNGQPGQDSGHLRAR